MQLLTCKVQWYKDRGLKMALKKHQTALTLLRNQSRLQSEQWEDQVEVELAEEKVWLGGGGRIP